MGFHVIVAVNLPPILKVMLTCFLSNKRALGFYKRHGFEKDDISPGPRKFRSGKVVMPDYVIMSRPVVRSALVSADNPSEDKVSEEKPSEGKPSEEIPSEDKTTQDKPSGDKPSGHKRLKTDTSRDHSLDDKEP